LSSKYSLSSLRAATNKASTIIQQDFKKQISNQKQCTTQQKKNKNDYITGVERLEANKNEAKVGGVCRGLVEGGAG